MKTNKSNQLTDIDTGSQIIRGDQQFVEFLKIPIATFRRHADQIPHRKVGNVRISSKSVLTEWLEGRLQWPPVSENQSSPPSVPRVSNTRVSKKGGVK